MIEPTALDNGALIELLKDNVSQLQDNLLLMEDILHALERRSSITNILDQKN